VVVVLTATSASTTGVGDVSRRIKASRPSWIALPTDEPTGSNCQVWDFSIKFTYFSCLDEKGGYNIHAGDGA
jgi:hypothetical protein